MEDVLRRPLFEKKDLIWAGLFLLLFVAMFRDFFLMDRMIFERDTTVIEVPTRKLTVQLLREGHFALWTDAYGSGQPFLANPKNAVLYPATLLYLLFPLFIAFKLFYVLHVLAGWLGLYYLGKAYGLARRSAFLLACLFIFGGMYLSSFEFYNHVAAMAWMPWILVTLKAGPERTLPKTALLAVFWTLMVLAGAPEFVLITAVLSAALALAVPGRWKRDLVIAGMSLVLSLFISAAQLLPSLELLRQSGRAGESATWPLELLQLPNLVFPGILGNDREPGHSDFWGWHLFDKKFPLYYSLYIGFGATILSLLALRKRRDRLRLALLITGLGFFLVACGRYSPFFFIHRVLPFVSSIRYPVKFFLGSVLCLSFLAGLGFDDLVRGQVPGRRFIRILILSAVIPSAIFWALKDRILGFLNRLLIIDLESSLAQLGGAIGAGLILLAAYAVILLMASRREGRAPALIGFVLVLAVMDPAYHNRFVNPTAPSSFFNRPPLLERLGTPVVIEWTDNLPPFLKETVSDNRKLLRYFRHSLYPFTGLGDGVRYVLDMDFYGAYSRAYKEKVESVQKLPSGIRARILTSLGCNWSIGADGLAAGEDANEISIEGRRIYIEKIPGGMDAPFIARRIHRAASQDEVLSLFAQTSFDPLKDAAVPQTVPTPNPPHEQESTPGSLITLERSQGFGRYKAVLPSDGVAVFPGNRAPGWRAWIDGRSAEIFEANLFSKGVFLPSGEHDVLIRYLPGSVVLGAMISLATIFILAAGMIGAAVRIRRKARPGRP